MSFKQPISVSFVWHPADSSSIQGAIDYCFNMLKRDSERPFSRTLNLPVFLLTSEGSDVPKDIKIDADKNIVFIFISQFIVGDDKWLEYVEKIPTDEFTHIIPIALDKYAFSVGGSVANNNFIRMFEFEEAFEKENLLISITHEIYRLALNENYNDVSVGNDTAIKLFLSHAKKGTEGLKIANALKTFIDGKSMNRFFDATDIAPGYQFDNEIIQNLKKSTLIAIHSNAYSSSYWCQKEIQCSKENDRPIVAVDCLTEYEDRRFPFSSNIPSIRCNINDIEEVKKSDLYNILISSLIETVRYFYSKDLLCAYKKNYSLPDDVVILARPPEVADIIKAYAYMEDDAYITKETNANLFIYPEPPVYESELSIFKQLGLKVVTPLSYDTSRLSDQKIGISISEPSNSELIDLGLVSSHLTLLSQDISRHLLARESVVIYGGDLRPGGFSEFILQEAQALQSRMKETKIFVKNYLAWPIFKNDTQPLIKWKAQYRSIAGMIEVSPPEDIIELIPDLSSFLVPRTIEHRYIWARSLTKMREEMITDCDIRICAGGKHTNYKGRMPGVLEEILISIKMNKPAYILGGFGGVCHSVSDVIKTQQIPDKLSNKWQVENNTNYEGLLDMINNKNAEYLPKYEELVSILTHENLNNGLSEEDNLRLLSTSYVDEAIHLILKGVLAKTQ